MREGVRRTTCEIESPGKLLQTYFMFEFSEGEGQESTFNHHSRRFWYIVKSQSTGLLILPLLLTPSHSHLNGPNDFPQCCGVSLTLLYERVTPDWFFFRKAAPIMLCPWINIPKGYPLTVQSSHSSLQSYCSHLLPDWSQSHRSVTVTERATHTNFPTLFPHGSHTHCPSYVPSGTTSPVTFSMNLSLVAHLVWFLFPVSACHSGASLTMLLIFLLMLFCTSFATRWVPGEQRPS